jgi:hypothetical protein
VPAHFAADAGLLEDVDRLLFYTPMLSTASYSPPQSPPPPK